MLRIHATGDHSNYHCGSKAAWNVISAEAARHGRLVTAKDEFDLLVVNGEGSMHHNSRGFRKKMDQIERALEQNRRVMLVNTVWQDNPQRDADVLKRCERVVVREVHSQQALAAQGVSAEIAFDQSFYDDIDPDAPFIDFSDRIVLTDFWAQEFDAFAWINSKWAQKFVTVDMQAMSWSSLVRSLRTAKLLVTGRHHAVYAACRARCPFVALTGNTHKIEGLMDTAGIQVPVFQDFSALKQAIDDGVDASSTCESLFDWMEQQPAWQLAPPASPASADTAPRSAASTSQDSTVKKPPKLDSPEALVLVQHLRQSRDILDPLRATLAPLLSGRRCLVLGSAPGARLPEPHLFERCVCVNGSPRVAAGHGLTPDLTIMAGYTTLVERDVSRQSLEQLSGLHAGRLLFVSAGNDRDSARRVLSDSGLGFDEWLDIDPLGRAAIAGEATGEGEPGLGHWQERVSNGVFALLVALWAGAEHVTIAGITLTGGHDYIEGDTPRHHVAGDQRCLETLARLHGARVATTDEALAEATGLALLPEPAVATDTGTPPKRFSLRRLFGSDKT